jgi:tRNA (guanine37-N1)-methyltransferase
MKFEVITLFPKMFEGVFGESMVRRAKAKGLVEIRFHDMRQWAWNSYGAVDDRPYGGGLGMLIRVDVINNALTGIKPTVDSRQSTVILLSARGKRFTQEKAEELAKFENIILICGHYEGFDERVRQLADEEISIGDYVLTGGEIPAMVIIDAVTRLIPGVLGKDESNKDESFSEKMVGGKKVRGIEYPQYTRPEEYQGMKVPKVLLSGDPKKIREWQERTSLGR